MNPAVTNKKLRQLTEAATAAKLEYDRAFTRYHDDPYRPMNRIKADKSVMVTARRKMNEAKHAVRRFRKDNP